MELINKDNFEDKIKNNKFATVTFSTKWCGPCKMLASTLESIDVSDVLIAKIDAEDNINISTHFGIRSVPTTLFFKDGVLVDDYKITGNISKQDLLKKLEEFKNG
jgi:thioredoxin 1